MLSNFFSRRAFATRIASLLPGLGIAAAASSAVPSPAPAKDSHLPKKLNAEGKPADKGFITPLIIHNGVIYIAGIGAHSHNKAEIPKDITSHTKSVMDSVKQVVEAGGGTMDSILQLTVFLNSIDDYKGMNEVFKGYFPNGGPARTTVAVAMLPGDSLVEINCTAAVVNKK